MTSDPPVAPSRVRLPLVVGMLAVGQMIGWGTTYNMIATIWRPIGAELGIARDVLYFGPTLMLIVSAFLSPPFGRAIDRHGAREIMIVGSLVLAAGLAVMASAQGVASYLAAWVLFGLGAPMVLTNAGFAMIAAIAGPQARRAMTAVTLLGALSSTLSWPTTTYLDAAIGWRGTLLVFAALHVLVCVPLQWALPRRAVVTGGPSSADDGTGGTMPEALRRRAALFFALATALQGLVSWGMFLNLIAILEARGHGAEAALWIASLVGPASIAARALDFVGAKRFPVVDVALVAFAGMLLSIVVMAVLGGSAWGAILTLVLYGGSTGMIALARATVPYELFGRLGYATLLGRLALPQNLAFAASPVVFALAMERGGVWFSLGASALTTAIAAAAFFQVWRMAKQSSR